MSSFVLKSSHWEKIFDENPLAIAILDCEGNIVYANKKAEIILGIKKDSITARSYDSPQWKHTDIDGNPFPDEQQPFIRVKQERTAVHNIRHFIEWPDQKKILLNIDAYPIFNDQDDLTYVVALMEDITEKYVLIQERDEQYKNYQLLFSNMTNAYAFHRMLYDGQGNPEDYVFLDINDHFTELTGLTRKQVIGRKIGDIIPNFRKESAKFIEIYGKVAKTRVPYTFEQYDVILDRTWLVSAYSPEPDHFITLFIDLTDQKRIEEELRRSENKYKNLFQNLPLGVGVAKKDGQILEFNQQILEIFGYTSDEILQLNVSNMYADPSNRELVISQIKQNGGLSNSEFLLKRKNGESFEAIINVNPIQIGTDSYLMTAIQDVSEIRQLEREKAQIEEKVRVTQKLESLGVLAGGIAHDFNNLLVGILGNAELALMDLSLQNTQECLQEIILSAKRASELSQQMLIYAGKHQIQEKLIDLNAEVLHMRTLLKRVVSKNAEFVLDLASDLPPISGDPSQIRQVIMNLVTNASDALEDKLGVIRLSTQIHFCDESFLVQSYLENSLPPGEYVHLTVEDTGVGISSGVMRKIFEPFFSTKAQGRGLGLSAVLGIVRNHDASLIIETEEGSGSKFHVLFPPRSGLISENNLLTKQKPTVDYSDLSILLIDDDSTVLKVGYKYLTNLGVHVETAHSGSEALRKLKTLRKPFDAIILDLVMPIMDGYTLFHEIRKFSSTVPIYISSGYSEFDIQEKFKGEKIAGFLQKPYTFDKIKTILNQWKNSTS